MSTEQDSKCVLHDEQLKQMEQGAFCPVCVAEAMRIMGMNEVREWLTGQNKTRDGQLHKYKVH